MTRPRLHWPRARVHPEVCPGLHEEERLTIIGKIVARDRTYGNRVCVRPKAIATISTAVQFLTISFISSNRNDRSGCVGFLVNPLPGIVRQFIVCIICRSPRYSRDMAVFRRGGFSPVSA